VVYTIIHLHIKNVITLIIFIFIKYEKEKIRPCDRAYQKTFQRYLESWLPVLREAFLAIDRSVPAGLEGYFTFFLAVGANRLVHLSWASVTTSAPESTVSHDNFPVRE
jgi:hypothetical protein